MDLLARANKPENMERTIKDLSREMSWAKILEGTSLFTTRGVRVFTDGEDLGPVTQLLEASAGTLDINLQCKLVCTLEARDACELPTT